MEGLRARSNQLPETPPVFHLRVTRRRKPLHTLGRSTGTTGGDGDDLGLPARRSVVSGARWPACYEVRVEGVLDGSWSEWFEGLQIQNKGGDTVLSGILPDQSALHGILDKVRDLGLTIIAVRRLPYMEPGAAPQ
jgi:hypothetical protein